MNWRCLFRKFLGRSDAFDISRKGDGIENGPSDTLAGEMPRVPATYGKTMRMGPQEAFLDQNEFSIRPRGKVWRSNFKGISWKDEEGNGFIISAIIRNAFNGGMRPEPAAAR